MVSFLTFSEAVTSVAHAHSLLSSQFCYQGLTLQTEKKRERALRELLQRLKKIGFTTGRPPAHAVVLKFFCLTKIHR